MMHKHVNSEVFDLSSSAVRWTMWSCILLKRISARTSLACGWQSRVQWPLHHAWILTAASHGCVSVRSRSSTEPFWNTTSLFSACCCCTLLSERSMWSDPCVSDSSSGGRGCVGDSSSGGQGCVDSSSSSGRGWVDVGGARESSNSSSPLSAAEAGWTAGLKGRKADSEDSRLPWSFSSSVCTSSRIISSSAVGGRRTAAITAEDTELIHAFTWTPGSTSAIRMKNESLQENITLKHWRAYREEHQWCGAMSALSTFNWIAGYWWKRCRHLCWKPRRTVY